MDFRFNLTLPAMIGDMSIHIVGKRPFPYERGYSGPVRRTRYFEGWYHRHLNADGSASLAVIAGVTLAPDPHAFIQLISGPEHKVVKVRYPLEAFRARRDRYEVELGGNRFSTGGMVLDIERDGTRIRGAVSYTDAVRYPESFLSPGIMGPYSWAPFMECIHGVLAMDHKVNGEILWDGRPFDFREGRGYLEKDRGRSMPSEWIWLQANKFETPGDSLMLSIARIPWLGSSFVGHLGFLRHDGRLFRIGTYARTRVSGRVDSEGLSLIIRGSAASLEIRVDGRDGEADWTLRFVER